MLSFIPHSVFHRVYHYPFSRISHTNTPESIANVKHFISSVNESQNESLHTPHAIQNHLQYSDPKSVSGQPLSLCSGIRCPLDRKNPVRFISIFPTLNRAFGNFLLIKLRTNLPLSHAHCTEKNLFPQGTRLCLCCYQ